MNGPVIVNTSEEIARKQDVVLRGKAEKLLRSHDKVQTRYSLRKSDSA